jgi:hypothetical protein
MMAAVAAKMAPSTADTVSSFVPFRIRGVTSGRGAPHGREYPEDVVVVGEAGAQDAAEAAAAAAAVAATSDL